MSVIDSKTKSILLSTYNNIDKQSLPNKGDGWVNLVKFAPAIKKSGVDYHEFGYDKVGEFLNDIPDFDIYTDRSTFPPVKYIRLKNIIKKLPDIDEAKELVNDWKIGDNPVIGQYYYNRDDKYYGFKNIATLTFNDLTYLDGKEVEIILDAPIESLKINEFYEFQWIIIKSNNERGYSLEIMPHTPFRTIDPKQLVDRLYKVWANCDPTISSQMKDTMKMVSTQLTASSDGTFIYELLQNANDYPIEDESGNSVPVNVEFHITGDYLIYRHSGDFFTPRNIAAISKLAAGEKKAKKNAIGYKGIGFKTIFNGNDYAYLRSGEYSLRFDESARVSRDDPWQIMPIWTDRIDIDKRVNQLFDKGAERFRVQMAIRPKDQNQLRGGSNNTYEYLFLDIFKDEKDILFVPNLHSVQVFVDGLPRKKCTKNSSNWVLTRDPYVYLFNQEEIDEINNEVLASAGKIPDKYLNFKDTRVMFACRRNGNRLLPVENATVNCYLPTLAKFGFPFMFNTDMIPTGPRDNIELKIKLNERFARIAGAKCFLWIRDLLTSKKYHLGSVFSLVPDFKKCKKEHSDYLSLIEKFEEAFNESLQTGTIIHISQGFAPVCRVILDTTGLSTSGIMTDDQFHKFTGMGDYYLPLPILRNDKHFNAFLKRYAKDEQKFDVENLTELIANEDFQEWLKNQDNNNKFLNFLLENDYLEDYFYEKLFIEEECGKLFSAGELYYDIDEELKDLSAFSSHLCYLSFKTRTYFKDNEKWKELINGQFAEYDYNSFINDTLLSENRDETVEALKNWETSFHFYSYLAKKSIVPDDLRNLPFFNDETEATVVDDFNGKFVFLSSPEGKKTCSADWLSSVTFSFLSPNYDKATLVYLKKNAGVQDYSDDIIVNDIIQSEDYHDDINESQQQDIATSVAFVKFCFEHESSFDSGTLRNYALNSYDCDGDPSFVLYENNIYFPSDCFDEYSEKEWLGCDWMYSLDSDYLDIDNNEESVKSFLKKAFFIEELDADKFYKEIVRPNISSIISNTSGSNDGDGAKNLDFVSYLDANYKLIFETEKDADKFNSFILISDDDCDIDSDATYIYAHDYELKEILDSEWFPANIVNMCTSKYGDSKSIHAIKAKKYDFAGFFNDVITGELENINDTISSKESSIAFHSFVIDRLADLTDNQKVVMKGAKVYIYGSENPSNQSHGHHILSKSARELSSMGLVEFADLDIIDPDYHIEDNEDYWKKCLGNAQFTVTDFLNWLTDNKDTFYSTIKDKDNNLKFWRWIKGCKLSDQTLANLPILPIYLKTDKYVDSHNTIYLSDDYIEEGGLETIVTSYHPEASFISREYIVDDENVDAWKDFWIKMGVRFEMVDILIDTIDNRLSKTDDAKLPATIAKYRLKLDEHYDGELISSLTNLRVRAHDGEFYSLSEVIYVDCEKEEPFKFINLPMQASFATADERKLIIDILDEINGDKITKLTEWQQAKIDHYLEIQNDEDQDKFLRSVHYLFVDELAAMYLADKESLKELENITHILFLDSEGNFCEVSELTEGSLYNPFCDFEKYGLDYSYLSNSYYTVCKNDIRKMLNKVFKIHCDFEKDDIKNLSNRGFAIYFWSQYLLKRDADINGVKKLIDEREFDSVACIPTKDYMKLPGELYSLSITGYVKKHVVDWENKLPLESLPEIEYDIEEKRTLFGLLLNKPSNMRLSFCDALYALFSIVGQERRTQLLQWMIETYEEKYDVDVSEYRSDEYALWKNTKNEDRPITELYALSYSDKKLEQYFGNLPQIINKDYLPSSPLSFKNACDILQITTIEPEELIVDPIGQVSKNEFYKKNLKIFALVLAGYEDVEDWGNRYDQYCKLIDELKLWCCTDISIRYEHDENICQKLKKFYRKKGTPEFYFVKSLDEKRVFKPFVESFIEYLGIEADKDFVETVMDSRETALHLVQENNTLMLDEVFKDELNCLIPGIRRRLNGNEADDKDIFDIDKRHTFTGHTGKAEDEATEPETEQADYPPIGRLDGHSMGEQQSPDNDEAENDTINNEDKPHSKQIVENGIEYVGYDHRQRSFDSSSKPQRRHPLDNDDWHPHPQGSQDIEKYNPDNCTPRNVTEWKKDIPQAELGVADVTEEEARAITNLIGGSKTLDEIIDEHLVARYRMYNALKDKGYKPTEDLKSFIRNKNNDNHGVQTNNGYIHTRSAKGGILFLSGILWRELVHNGGRICMYYGNKAYDFEIIDSVERLISFVGRDNIIIQVSGENKEEIINSIFSGQVESTNAHILIRIKSNSRYNSMFETTFNAEDDNDFSIS